jgi:hypothetical protein
MRDLKKSLNRFLFGFVPADHLSSSGYAKIAVWSALKRHIKPRVPLEPLTIPKHARVAVVGNGPVAPGDGPHIDAHDVVIRFSGCKNYGVSGWKTDVLCLCNCGHLGAGIAFKGKSMNPMALADAKEVWLVRPREATAVHLAQWPEDADRWKDYTDEIVHRRLGDKPWRSLEPDLYWQAMNALARLGAGEKQAPSAGALVLFHLKGHFMPVEVTLFGFTHEGSEVHAWHAERQLVDQWSDWITRAQMLPEAQASVACG